MTNLLAVLLCGRLIHRTTGLARRSVCHTVSKIGVTKAKIGVDFPRLGVTAVPIFTAIGRSSRSATQFLEVKSFSCYLK